MSATADRYTRADCGSHTVTYWHAEVMVSEPVPDSDAWTVEHFYCPHHHDTTGTADRCAARAEHVADRTGRPPSGWTRLSPRAAR